MGAPAGTKDGAGLQILRKCRGVEGRRHDDDLQVGASRRLQGKGLGQRDVAVEVPLVKLVEEQGAHTREVRIPEHLAHENSLRDKEQAGRGAGGIIKPDAVADLVADAPSALMGYPGREHPGRQSPRLKDHGATGSQDPRIEEHLRDLGRFARSRRGLHDETVARSQFGNDLLPQLLDREIGAAYGGGGVRFWQHADG